MQPVSEAACRYDARTIAFHWATVVLVALQWGIAQVIDYFPQGAPRVAAKSTHIMIGLLVVAVVLARVLWRATKGRRLPAADRGVLHAVAKLTHWGMYGLLVTVLLLGMFTAWAQGASLYGLYKLPAYMPGHPDLGDQVAGVHGTAVTILLILAGLHSVAALIHHFVSHDGVLRRMLPRG